MTRETSHVVEVDQAMTRDQIRDRLVAFLLEKVHGVEYPSTTHLDLIEQSIPCHMVPEYLELLMEKVQQDSYPSIPMLRRIRRVAACLPRDDGAREARIEPPRAEQDRRRDPASRRR
jgi:hypothetical protein